LFLMVKTPRTRLSAAAWVSQIASGYSRQEHEGANSKAAYLLGIAWG
jgi:hypothetical protein